MVCNANTIMKLIIQENIFQFVYIIYIIYIQYISFILISNQPQSSFPLLYETCKVIIHQVVWKIPSYAFFFLKDNVSLRNAVSLLVILTEFVQLQLPEAELLSLCPFVRQCQKLEIHTAVGPRDPQCDGRLSDIKSLKHFFYGDTSASETLVRCVTHSEFLLLARF